MRSFLTAKERKILGTFASLAVILASVAATPFKAGNLLISRGFNCPHEVGEFTKSGDLLQVIKVPTLSGQDGTDYNRGIAVDDKGRLHVFNGTFHAYISTYDPRTSTWAHHTMPGFSISNNTTYGKLAAYSHYVFATDGHSGRAGDENGIVRLDTDTGKMTRFGSQSSYAAPIDVTIGKDGLLYTLNGETAPISIHVYNPDTLALVRDVPLLTAFAGSQGAASRSITVDSHGCIYLNQLIGPLYKLSADGKQVVATMQQKADRVPDYMNDMQCGADGQFLVIHESGRIAFLDADLRETRSFKTLSGGNMFGAFVNGSR